MRQREERFPRKIQALAELPGPVADAVLSQQPAESIGLIIVIPPGSYPVRRSIWGFELPFGWRRTPERTLVFGPERFTLVEVVGGEPAAPVTVPLAALLELYHFQVLLYSWLELRWSEAGEVRAVRAEYNSVGTSLLWQGLSAIRDSFARRPLDGPAIRPEELAEFPFKFRSYTLASLMDGEPLAGAVFQPAIRPQGKRWGRYISPNRAIALTDRNLILIEDQRHRLRWGDRGDADYAVIQRFFPLDRSLPAELVPGPAYDELVLRVEQGGAIHEARIPLEAPQAQRVRALLHPQPTTG